MGFPMPAVIALIRSHLQSSDERLKTSSPLASSMQPLLGDPGWRCGMQHHASTLLSSHSKFQTTTSPDSRTSAETSFHNHPLAATLSQDSKRVIVVVLGRISIHYPYPLTQYSQTFRVHAGCCSLLFEI